MENACLYEDELSQILWGKGAGMRKVDCGRVGFGDCFKRTRRPRDERPE